jgi:eukaryotic-like serine/threonine-protein kinase
VKERSQGRVGEVLAGRYRIEALLERGGQGHVYRGVDLKAGDEVAIKILGEKMARSPEWRERMFREAQALTMLSGTAAVRVYHQVWTDDGALCLVLELLRGQDFEGHLLGLESGGLRLEPAELVRVLDPIVETLERAHAQGILHRDLKPANIFLLEGGGVRLLDFGLAKFLRWRGLTRDGFVAGSPSYIAPEGWAGRSELLDQRSDVYSLSAVIYRALSGEPPFSSPDTRELLRLVTQARRPSLYERRRDLDPRVDDWVRSALASDAAERFQSVTAMWRAFQASVARR